MFVMFTSKRKKIITSLISNHYIVKSVRNTHSGSSGGFVNARKTQFTKIVRITKISKYLNSVKEFSIKNESTRHRSDQT